MIETILDAGKWSADAAMQAHTYRFDAAPAFRPGAGCICSLANPDHPEGYDNVSLLTRRQYAPGAAAELRCSFEGLGCPEIILVPAADACTDTVRYGACIEVVLYKDGINVWRHFREGDKCSWHKSLGWQFAVSEGALHTLRVATRPQYLDITVDGAALTLRMEDLFESFHFGLTLCEGEAAAYDMTVEQE